MSRHLEDSHDSQNSQSLSNSLDRVELIDERSEVVWKNGEQVDDVHEALDELTVIRTREEPDNEQLYTKL